MQENKANRTGQKLGYSIADTVALIYQRSVAMHFMEGLASAVNDVLENRRKEMIEKQEEGKYTKHSGGE